MQYLIEYFDYFSKNENYNGDNSIILMYIIKYMRKHLEILILNI